MASDLFSIAADTVRRAALSQFRRSTYAQLVNAVGDVARLPARVQPQAIERLVQRYGGRLKPEMLAREITGLDFGRFVRQVERYSKAGDAEKAAVEALLRQFGPTGKLIKSLIGSGALGKGSLQRELDAATRLLEAFGHVVVPPKGAPTVGQMRSGTQGLIDYLETQGYEVTRRISAAPPTQLQETLPFGIPVRTAAGQPRQVIDIPDPSGALRVRVEDPLVTGEFIEVSSSNVHSIAYDLENALLYVRFLGPAPEGEVRTDPGSLYQYRDVTPRQFQGFQRAASKGSWVWDNLRIRGTVSGHRKDYALVGVMHGYVPRKATLGPGGVEWFLKRQIYVGRGKWLESQLSDAPASFSRGEPNTGAARTPNTGRPRR